MKRRCWPLQVLIVLSSLLVWTPLGAEPPTTKACLIPSDGIKEGELEIYLTTLNIEARKEGGDWLWERVNALEECPEQMLAVVLSAPERAKIVYPERPAKEISLSTSTIEERARLLARSIHASLDSADPAPLAWGFEIERKAPLAEGEGATSSEPEGSPPTVAVETTSAAAEAPRDVAVEEVDIGGRADQAPDRIADLRDQNQTYWWVRLGPGAQRASHLGHWLFGPGVELGLSLLGGQLAFSLEWQYFFGTELDLLIQETEEEVKDLGPARIDSSELMLMASGGFDLDPLLGRVGIGGGIQSLRVLSDVLEDERPNLFTSEIAWMIAVELEFIWEFTEFLFASAHSFARFYYSNEVMGRDAEGVFSVTEQNVQSAFSIGGALNLGWRFSL